MKVSGRVSALIRIGMSTAAKTCLVWITLVMGSLRAEVPAAESQRSLVRPTNPPAAAAAPAEVTQTPRIVVDDVALGPPDGVLEGQLLGSANSRRPEPVAGRTVKLQRGNHTLAVTRSDDSGSFAISHLSAGMYRVVVEGPNGPGCRLCRLWTRRAAPPGTRQQINLLLGGEAIRGQGPFPLMSFKQAAAAAAVVGGAIATPIIYNNVKVANRVPTSP